MNYECFRRAIIFGKTEQVMILEFYPDPCQTTAVSVFSVLGATVNKFVFKNWNDCPYTTVAFACYNSQFCTDEGDIFTQYLTSEYKFPL